MSLLNLLIILVFMIFANEIQCRSNYRKGPYKLDQRRADIEAPSKTTLKLERAKIIKDATLAIIQRAYYKSYCYQGGPLDPNTSCFTGITQQLPGYEEATEWVTKNKCAVGPDCTDCWGRDSDACLRPADGAKHWVNEKTMTISSNNNHFAAHTCNINWKCSLHTVEFPTFISRKHNRWTYYTEFRDGTELNLDSKDFWTMEDVVLKKTVDPIMQINSINASCFKSENKPISCFDNELGNFVEFKENWKCTGQTCYHLNDMQEEEITSNKIVDLKAVSKEDLYRVIEMEHMQNEELRYNFALVLGEIADQREDMIKVILSVAKMDDKLLGAILGQNARSQFLTEKVFYLSPCQNNFTDNSNCQGNMTFRNGRWQEKLNESQCVNITSTTMLNLMAPKELWFPEIIDAPLIGTAENFDGWSYYVSEQDKLQKSIEWTKNLQSTTSFADIANYPKGFIESAITSFITLHSITYGILAMTIMYLYKKLQAPARFQQTQLQDGERAIQLQNIITMANNDHTTDKMTAISSISGVDRHQTGTQCGTPGTPTDVLVTDMPMQTGQQEEREPGISEALPSTSVTTIKWHQKDLNSKDHELGWKN